MSNNYSHLTSERSSSNGKPRISSFNPEKVINRLAEYKEFVIRIYKEHFNEIKASKCLPEMKFANALLTVLDKYINL